VLCVLKFYPRVQVKQTVKYSILVDADDRTKKLVVLLHDATGRQFLDCGDRSWICNVPQVVDIHSRLKRNALTL